MTKNCCPETHLGVHNEHLWKTILCSKMPEEHAASDPAGFPRILSNKGGKKEKNI
jgi:hypothetical protein